MKTFCSDLSFFSSILKRQDFIIPSYASATLITYVNTSSHTPLITLYIKKIQLFIQLIHINVSKGESF